MPSGSPPYVAFVKLDVVDVAALKAFSPILTGPGATDLDTVTIKRAGAAAPKIQSPVPGDTVPGLLLAQVGDAKAGPYVTCADGRAHVHGTAVLTPVAGTPQFNTAVVVWGSAATDLPPVAQNVRSACGTAAWAVFLPLLTFTG